MPELRLGKEHDAAVVTAQEMREEVEAAPVPPKAPLARPALRVRPALPVAPPLPLRLRRNKKPRRDRRFCAAIARVRSWPDCVSSSASAIPGPNICARVTTRGSGSSTRWRIVENARFGLECKLHGESAKINFAGKSLLAAQTDHVHEQQRQPVQAALSYWKIDPEECLVAHDDLDLPPGTARLKFDGGHGGQNGLRDIIAMLGHGKFHRLRIGIGHPGHKDKVLSWVLGRPSVADENVDHRRHRALAGRVAAGRRRKFQRGDETPAHRISDAYRRF